MRELNMRMLFHAAIFALVFSLPGTLCYGQTNETLGNRLGDIEKVIYGAQKNNSALLSRVESLETKLYGTAKQGTIEQRIENLELTTRGSSGVTAPTASQSNSGATRTVLTGEAAKTTLQQPTPPLGGTLLTPTAGKEATEQLTGGDKREEFNASLNADAIRNGSVTLPSSSVPRVIGTIHCFGGQWIGDLKLHVNFGDEGQTNTILEQCGPKPLIRPCPYYCFYYTLFQDGHCEYRYSGDEQLDGLFLGSRTIVPKMKTGFISAASAASLVRELDSVWPAGIDLAIFNEAHLFGTSLNSQCYYDLSGCQPTGGHYKSAAVFNHLYFLSGSSSGCFYGFNSPTCFQPITKADTTKIYNHIDYQLIGPYDINGLTGEADQLLSKRDYNVPSELTHFEEQLLGLSVGMEGLSKPQRPTIPGSAFD
jgi:hypothetical protein